MKSKLIGLLLSAALAFSPNAWSDAEAREAALAMMESINMERVLNQTIEQMVLMQLRNKPELQQFKDIMLSFFYKHMSYDSVKDEFADLYAEAFTAEELQQIAAFNATEVGQKALRELPTLAAKGAQIGQRRVQENRGELAAMIQAHLDAQKEPAIETASDAITQAKSSD